MIVARIWLFPLLSWISGEHVPFREAGTCASNIIIIIHTRTNKIRSPGKIIFRQEHGKNRSPQDMHSLSIFSSSLITQVLPLQESLSPSLNRLHQLSYKFFALDSNVEKPTENVQNKKRARLEAQRSSIRHSLIIHLSLNIQNSRYFLSKFSPRAGDLYTNP